MTHNKNDSTGNLLNELNKSKDIHAFIHKNLDVFIELSLPAHLSKLITEKKLVKSEVIARSRLTKIYMYQIFEGKRAPTRNKVLALALAMCLSPDECNYLLKHARCRELYPKVKFDAILIFALKEGLGVMETNEVLYDYELELLE